ncbi:MAG: malto-oligosyltrehalose trehalohydrolase, partial [Bacteroidetes bacterium]|nr:malto-oligosyltrehalose trehalohydrolase [Bacteroidota bacterium]
MPRFTRSRHGAFVTDRGVQFRLWAPHATTVTLSLEAPDRELPLTPGDDGWFTRHVNGLQAGARYRYRLDGGPPLPDPASRYQPDGVHGPSEVIDPSAYTWQDDG